MKRLFSFLLILVSFSAIAQKTPSQYKTDTYNNIRTQPYNPTRAGNQYDNAIDASKSFYVDGTASGTNTYAVTITNTSVTSYVVGQWFVITFTNANSSTTVTLNVTPSGGSALGALAIKDNSGADPAVGDIKAGGTYLLHYNGTNLRIIGAAGGGGASVSSVTGTTNRITSSGGTTPAIDIAATYVGQSSITTLGTITTGVWTGTDIAYANIAQGSALSVLGVAGNATADNASITAGTDGHALRRSGTTLGFGTLGNSSISDLAWSKITSPPTTLSGYGITDAESKYITHNVQTSNYQLVLTDADTKSVGMNVASANNLTVPANATVAFPTGTVITIVQKGAGQTTIVAAGGVTINSSSGVLTSPGQNSPMVLVKEATDTWYLWNGTPPLTASNGLNISSNIVQIGGPMTQHTTLSGSFNLGLGISPTARIHIDAGTATANTAPLKFTSGTLLTTAEAGAVEFLTDKGYLTITTGAARKELTLNDAALTSGRVPFSTTNGRLTDDADFTFSGGNTLNVTQLNVGTGTAITQYISATAALDFPSTAASTCEVLTITLTGAALGDNVILGVPNASVPDPEGIYPSAWVSATNTVTVKFCNLQTVSALDPASGTFKVSIIK